MSERIHALAQHLLGKASLEECTLDELQQLTKRYPYFAPAQFLLLQKLKSAGSPDDEAQQRKAVLYFHDPLLFDYFISSDRFYFDGAAFASPVQPHLAKEHEADTTRPKSTMLADDQVFLQQDSSGMATDEFVEEPFLSTEESGKEKATAPTEPQPFFAEQPNLENDTPNRATELEVPVESITLPVGIETPHRENEAQAGTEQPEKTSFEKEEEEAEDTGDENLFRELIAEENPPEDPAVALPVESLSSTASESDNQRETSTQAAEAAVPVTVLKAAKTSGAPLPADNGGLLFEPYHTVDYFASQGIKITAEELPKDKLGKQLRSFTEWLRVMKRLPAAEMARTPESSAEKNVETLASHSVVESDVITEAMAEVWVKQGNRQKAMETYNKLGLLNPSKKAYFAAKIENLKGS